MTLWDYHFPQSLPLVLSESSKTTGRNALQEEVLTVQFSAAVIHYKPQRGNCSIIDPDKVYLCDSGAQYLDGTTDTTRTLHFGKPTDAEKEAYTLVLKGNIALDVAVFPKGTTGYALDSLARQHLWVSLNEDCRWRLDNLQ